jgi:hypothetical protein
MHSFLSFFWSLAIICFLPINGIAQISGVSVIEIDNKDVVSGRTYQVFVNFVDSLDKVDAVMSLPGKPLVIHSSSTFYQHPKGSAIASEVQRSDIINDAALAYDSWVTIDFEDNYLNKAIVYPPGSTFLDKFENDGSTIIGYEDSRGGAWFVGPSEVQGIAQSDFKVLIGQFTTKGVVSGIINVMGRKTVGDNELPDGSHRGVIKAEELYFTCPPSERGIGPSELLKLAE